MRGPPQLVWIRRKEYAPLNAKSGEPEGLPDLARAAYWDASPAVKRAAAEKVRKVRTFLFRSKAGTHSYEHVFYDDRSLN
jgi:hypothetical protein